MKTFNKKTVFIVDDDVVYLEIMKHELRNLEEVKIETFSSAESCLEQMYKEPQVIILDYYLDSVNKNNMTGHKALEFFQGENPRPQILFISSKINRGLLEEYQKYRNVDFIIKTPDGSRYLLSKVKKLLRAA
ncbi:MAG: response regulator [Flavobacteriales bacterium]|nr:response regulator [Flavobacteriales bacterium]